MPYLELYIWQVAAVAAAAGILLGVGLYASKLRQRTRELQMLFGPEYDRALKLYGDQGKAEAALESRRRRLRDMGAHELSDVERERFRQEWNAIQTESPEDPARTLIRSNVLLTDVMQAEGCRTVDEDERRTDVALMHPTIAEDYRAAADTLDKHHLGIATTDECRRAVLRFSSIFESILGPSDLRDRLKKVS